MAWRITDYNMQSISHKTEASINTEYDRLRKIVEKRVATFEKRGKGQHRYVKEARQSIGDNETIRDKSHAIIDMKRFLSSQHGSYEKWLKTMHKTIEFWQTQGIEGLDMGNIEDFLAFLDWERWFYGYKYSESTPYPPAVRTDWNKKIQLKDTEALFEFFSNKLYGLPDS